MGRTTVLKLGSTLLITYVALAIILINIIQLMPNEAQAADLKSPIGKSILISNDRAAEVKPEISQLPLLEVSEVTKPVEYKSQDILIAQVPQTTSEVQATQAEKAVAIEQSIVQETPALPPQTVTLAEAPLSPEQIARKAQLKERTDKVYKFLKDYGAPLAEKAEYLVDAADRFGIDYRLLASISIIESGGGKKCSRPFNAWGWGGVRGITFTSWEEAIDTISKALKELYYDRGAKTPDQISKYYNPESAADWAAKVKWVMAQM